MDERTRTRVPFHVRASIQYNGRNIEGDVENLSLNGLFMNTREDLSLNTITKIIVHLSGSSSELSLNLQGKIIRKEEAGIAFSFMEMDLDSYIHLRNIMTFNRTDSGKIIQEFEEARVDTEIKD
ncbi:MAG: PilZ domain-containing protein [Spirochaetae bacterium HGW-Spirochaetae-1]|jgi:hypothetical protein|nr:MAG: PilZ domain-containing protein [Spirochaetae bacterium HGW-Spirochaetae-1]